MITKRGDRMAFVAIEDRSGRQEIAVFSDLFTEVRELLKTDNLIIVQGEAKPDEYTGGTKMRALKIMDLPTARKQMAKKLRLEINAVDGLADDFILQLKKILQPYHPGNCKIELHYKQQQANAVLQFGQEWTIAPNDELLNMIDQLGDQVRAVVCYAD